MMRRALTVLVLAGTFAAAPRGARAQYAEAEQRSSGIGTMMATLTGITIAMPSLFIGGNNAYLAWKHERPILGALICGAIAAAGNVAAGVGYLAAAGNKRTYLVDDRSRFKLMGLVHLGVGAAVGAGTGWAWLRPPPGRERASVEGGVALLPTLMPDSDGATAYGLGVGGRF